ncbi:MAG TPA: DUF5615 family PIN-like protein [Armatimonadota bacterium]
MADHCVPGPIIDALLEEGFRVERVVDVADPRATDEEVAALAAGMKAVLVTADSDFTSRSHFAPRRYAGIVVLKDLVTAERSVLRRLVRVLRGGSLRGMLIVVDGRSSRAKR